MKIPRVYFQIHKKEVEMMPGMGFPVMDGVIDFPSERTRKAFLSTDRIKVDPFLIGDNTDTIHPPWRRESKDCGKQFSMAHNVLFSHQSRSANGMDEDTVMDFHTNRHRPRLTHHG